MDLGLIVHVPATVQDMTEAPFKAFAVKNMGLPLCSRLHFHPEMGRHLASLSSSPSTNCILQKLFSKQFWPRRPVCFFFSSHPAHTYRVEVVLQTLQTKNRRLITPVQLEYRMEVPYWESQTGKTRDLFSLLRTPFIEHRCHSWRSGPLTPPTALLCKVAHKFCEGKEVDLN